MISPLQRAATSGSFKKGVSGNAAGKPKGTPNRATAQAREMAALIVDDPEYRANLRLRMIAGTAANMEPLLWAYAKGKPVDRVETGGPGAFSNLSDDDLADRLRQAVEALGRPQN
jgi:hypothetical protein